MWISAKRLERGRFHWPVAAAAEASGAKNITMRPEELAMLLNGLDLRESKRRKNWLNGANSARVKNQWIFAERDAKRVSIYGGFRL